MGGAEEPIRVLHVDDEPGFAEIAGEFLRREDDRFRITTATSAEEGLASLADTPVDCVVSDYDMPGENGIEFLESVRERRPDLPFVLFTGKGGEEVASDAISAGVTDYLQKTGDASQYTVLANRIANAVEQYRSRRELAASRRRLSLLIDQSPLAVVEWNQDFEIVRANSAAEEIFGYASEDLVGGSWERIVPESLHGDVAALFESLRADGGGYHSVNENVTADGDRIVCEWHNRVVTDDDGEVVAILSQVQDVTDRRRRERAIEELHDTAEAFATADSRSAVADIVVDSAQEVLDLPMTGVHFYDPDTDMLVPARYSERAQEMVAERPRFERGEGLCWDAYDSGETRIYDDVSTVPNRYNPDTDVGSEMILSLGDHGVLIVGAAEPAALDETDVSLAETLATHATTALDRLDREADLRRTSARLQAVVEGSPDMISIHDDEGSILEVNRHLCEETGYDEATLLEMKVWDLDANTDPARARELWSEMTVGDRRRLKTEYRRADGSTFPVEVDVRRLDLVGEDRFVAIGRNVTDRVRREETLRELQGRTEEMVRAADREEIAEIAVSTARDTLDLPLSGVHLVDETGDELEPVAVTDEVVELLGRPPSYSRKSPSRSTDAINWRIFESGETQVIDDTESADGIADDETPSRSGIVHPLGDHGLFITSSPEPNAFDDTDVALTEILATITTAALDRAEREAELREQKRRLEAETERLEEFASIVSHDLRNPLDVARGRLAFARRERDSDHLAAVDRAQERMEALIDDILTLAREGAAVENPTPVALRQAVDRCWQNVDTGSATLVTETDRRILASEDRLLQLLENLFRNAVEHGGETVTVTVGDLEDGDGFYVADDGPGVSPENREKIFETGYSTSREGTGFGLSIVQKAVDAHGWTVGVTESDSGGARFEIRGVEYVE